MRSPKEQKKENLLGVKLREDFIKMVGSMFGILGHLKFGKNRSQFKHSISQRCEINVIT